MKRRNGMYMLAIVLFLTSIGSVGDIHAQEAPPVENPAATTTPNAMPTAPLHPAKDGFYLGLCIPYNTISSDDFDGKDSFTAEESNAIALVPELDGAIGIGVNGGYRAQQVAVDVNILYSEHDASWSNYGYYALSDEASLLIFDLNLKYFLNPASKAQPFLLGGFNVCTLTAEGYASVAGNTEDAVYSGYGLNLGGGIAYYINPQVAINGALIYRYSVYDRLEVDDENGDLDDDLNSGSLNLLIGMSYTF